DSEIFRPSIDGIRDDEDGPQIDLEANVLPNLNDHVLILTDTTVPSSVESDRILLAIAIKDYQTIANAVRKAMEVEPDVFQIESVPGIEIWKVQRGEGGELDEEFFQDFGFDDEVADEQEPLLNTWSIAAIPQGPAMTSAYLVFASHLELLEKVANRMADAAPTAPLVDAEEFQTLIGHLSRLGVNEQSIQRIVRFRYSLRTKYELLRKGELRQSDSILSTLVRRAIDEAEFEEEFDRPNQSKWPEFAAVEKYFRNAVSFVETTDSGWTLNGFLLR
ncbi:MAG: membrane or secreted protein, partial [Planctomycetota bacterium]